MDKQPGRRENILQWYGREEEITTRLSQEKRDGNRLRKLRELKVSQKRSGWRFLGEDIKARKVDKYMIREQGELERKDTCS